MNNITIRNIDPQNISINGGGTVIGITKVYVNGRDVTDGSVAYVVVPTKTSELENNSGFITTETDPTVPYYVKQISLSDISRWNSKQNQLISGSNIKTINNNSILGSGNLEIEGNTYTAGNGISISNSNVITNLITSYNSLSDKPTIPTKTSDLLNDSDFTTRSEFAQVAFSGSYLDLTDEPVIPQNTSDLYNDSGFITNSTNQLENYMLKSYLDTILPKTTATGTIINLSDSAGTPLTLSLAPSELSQDGTPTPSTPQDIHLASGNNSVIIEGKNLLNAPESLSITGNTVINVKVPANTEFTISMQSISLGGSNASLIQYRDANGSTISTNAFDSNNLSHTRTFTTEMTSIRLYSQNNYNNSQGITSTFNKMMVRTTEDSTYEPYVSQTAQINLGSKEFCKIGDYSDEFYLATDSDATLESGKWYIKKIIDKVVLDGTESWDTTDSGLATQMFRVHLPYDHLDRGSAIPIYSNYYLFCKRSDNPWNVNNSISYDSGNQIRIKDDSSSDLATYKTWLSTHNTIVYYVMATPTYTLLDNTIQEQLNNITKNLMSYTPQTNISQTNADLPFVISASTFKIIGG